MSDGTQVVETPAATITVEPREETASEVIEAVVAALDALEAPQSFAALLRPFDALIEGQIAAMGEAVFVRNHQR